MSVVDVMMQLSKVSLRLFGAIFRASYEEGHSGRVMQRDILDRNFEGAPRLKF